MNKVKVLIADSELVSLQHEKSFFRNRTHCHVMDTQYGKEALEIVEKERPDIVLIDTHMPDMHGAKFCDLVKSNPDLKGTSVILMLDADRARQRDLCAQTGCDDVIMKPVNRMDLLNKVHTYTGLPIREHLRANMKGQVYYDCEGNDSDGQMINISEGGIGIRSREPVPVGSTVNMRFRIPGVDKEISALCKSVWIKEQSPDSSTEAPSGFGYKASFSYLVGLRFTTIPDEAAEAIARL